LKFLGCNYRQIRHLRVFHFSTERREKRKKGGICPVVTVLRSCSEVL
jgi:hypothetical protein